MVGWKGRGGGGVETEVWAGPAVASGRAIRWAQWRVARRPASQPGECDPTDLPVWSTMWKWLAAAGTAGPSPAASAGASPSPGDLADATAISAGTTPGSAVDAARQSSRPSSAGGVVALGERVFALAYGASARGWCGWDSGGTGRRARRGMGC